MFFYPLKFPFDLLQNEELVPCLPKKPHIRMLKQDLKYMLSPGIFEVFDSLKLELSLLEVFRRPPDLESVIHTDSGGGDYAKLNWIFGGKGSTMKWYKTKNHVSKSCSLSDISTPFTSYTIDEVDLMVETKMTGANLVQVGVPHNVYNPPIEERHCFSLVYRKDKRRPTLGESIKLFADYIDYERLSIV